MKIKFINHACITIHEGEEMIMFDPWFSGRVFNNSWSLIKETNIDHLDLVDLKYILITHEHPDHLHWPSLKDIKEKVKHEIKIIVPKRRNKNIAKELIKIGFQVAEIPTNKQFSISKNFKVTNFTTGHDSAYIVQVGNKTILNQNDCKLSDSQVAEIVKNYPKIDHYFMQFSLAGFYGNKGKSNLLSSAKESHISMIEKYRSKFNPKITIPFASYIYFCREENCYLNDYMVNLWELDAEYQFVSYGDEILNKDFLNRNKLNIKKWNDNLSQIKIDQTRKIDRSNLIEATKIFLNDLGEICPPTTIFNFYSTRDSFVVDYKNKICYFSRETKDAVGKVTMYDLECFFRFPWGADTLNITSCFEVYDEILWKKNLKFKDEFYRR